MADREKVIKGLEICKPSKYSRTCGICPYREEMNCDYEVYNDALSLLKEQEAEKALDLLKGRKKIRMLIEGGGSSWWYVCEECQTAVDKKDKFCRQCGGEFV